MNLRRIKLYQLYIKPCHKDSPDNGCMNAVSIIWLPAVRTVNSNLIDILSPLGCRVNFFHNDAREYFPFMFLLCMNKLLCNIRKTCLMSRLLTFVYIKGA